MKRICGSSREASRQTTNEHELYKSLVSRILRKEISRHVRPSRGICAWDVLTIPGKRIYRRICGRHSCGRGSGRGDSRTDAISFVRLVRTVWHVVAAQRCRNTQAVSFAHERSRCVRLAAKRRASAVRI